jgi:hypothetical protein
VTRLIALGGIFFVLSRLWRFADLTSVMTRKKLVHSLVIPNLLYCDVIYTGASVEVNRRHNVVLNSCARYIFGVPQFHSISSYSAQLL